MPVECVCQNPVCGKTFFVPPSQVVRGGGKYCSYPCFRTPERFECQRLGCGKIFQLPPSRIAAGEGKFCSLQCRLLAKPRDERFWEKVLRCGHGEDCPFCCWPWQAGQKKGGYGFFVEKVDGKKKAVPAQRVAWELINKRPMPRALWGLHHCDFPPCCNPWHIYPGTATDNTLDAIHRNRYRHPKGELHGMAQLRETDIPVIRQRYIQGDMTTAIARDFGVSDAAIYLIIKGKNWRHVP